MPYLEFDEYSSFKDILGEDKFNQLAQQDYEHEPGDQVDPNYPIMPSTPGRELLPAPEPHQIALMFEGFKNFLHYEDLSSKFRLAFGQGDGKDISKKVWNWIKEGEARSLIDRCMNRTTLTIDQVLFWRTAHCKWIDYLDERGL